MPESFGTSKFALEKKRWAYRIFCGLPFVVLVIFGAIPVLIANMAKNLVFAYLGVWAGVSLRDGYTEASVNKEATVS